MKHQHKDKILKNTIKVKQNFLNTITEENSTKKKRIYSDL